MSGYHPDHNAAWRRYGAWTSGWRMKVVSWVVSVVNKIDTIGTTVLCRCNLNVELRNENGAEECCCCQWLLYLFNLTFKFQAFLK